MNQCFEEKPEKLSQRTASASKNLHLYKGIKFSGLSIALGQVKFLIFL